MAVITFEEFFELMKTEVCLVTYKMQSDNIATTNISIKCTLLSEHIPTGDQNQINLKRSLEWNDLYLTDTDSARAEISLLSNGSEQEDDDGNMIVSAPKIKSIGTSLKVWSMNYAAWFNLHISKILSVEIVDIQPEETE
tara:strand:- start:39 stop:455 length:417 start_codon:yes stop_codon:yes gene_type:complete